MCHLVNDTFTETQPLEKLENEKRKNMSCWSLEKYLCFCAQRIESNTLRNNATKNIELHMMVREIV